MSYSADKLTIDSLRCKWILSANHPSIKNTLKDQVIGLQNFGLVAWLTDL
jgi:hypothetical protein